jgi:hypothetical protein
VKQRSSRTPASPADCSPGLSLPLAEVGGQLLRVSLLPPIKSTDTLKTGASDSPKMLTVATRQSTIRSSFPIRASVEIKVSESESSPTSHSVDNEAMGGGPPDAEGTSWSGDVVPPTDDLCPSPPIHSSNSTDSSSKEIDENRQGEQSQRLDDVQIPSLSREIDYIQTQTELQTCSQMFMEHLRGAALRRKRDMARSRDSLVKKVQEQREALEAEAKVRDEAQRRFSVPAQLPSETKSKLKFFARPMPLASSSHGAGGLSGVPKIPKRASTVPFSPLLGNRRQLRHIDVNQNMDEVAVPSEPQPTKNSTWEFRARPVPLTTGACGHGGLAGVPRVPTRPPTVPESPLLGP